MPTDLTLKQALADMETAWRRLREVLDGPDVAAALVERQTMQPMSTAPRDGTWITLHLIDGHTMTMRWVKEHGQWPQWKNASGGWVSHTVCRGWSPVK